MPPGVFTSHFYSYGLMPVSRYGEDYYRPPRHGMVLVAILFLHLLIVTALWSGFGFSGALKGETLLTIDVLPAEKAKQPPPRLSRLNYGTPLSTDNTFAARLEGSYTGPRYSIFFSHPYEFSGVYRQMPGYALLNLRAAVKHGERWSAAVFINNLTNRHAELESRFTENEPQPSFTRIETNQPLTGGIDLTYRY